MKSDSFKNVFMNNAAIIIVSVLLMALSIFIGCFSETLQKYGLPIMIAFTLLFAILVGIICAKTKPEIVLTATAITAAIVVALTIFACTCRYI
jgi:FtsH-binding integral membrane protein